ncbi:MAG: hypothetical protein ACKOEM_06965 [Planctomycetia bacterium]
MRGGMIAAGLALAALAGCGGTDRLPPAAAAEALVAIVGPLPAGLEIVLHEPRGEMAAAWIVRFPGRWRPHEATDHRHATLPVDSFMNLVAATAQGTVDPGQPVEQACRYTEWRMEAAAGPRRLVRSFQLTTDRGELTVLETLPDPAGG